jgi:PPK2 family polyphosphate:nucleotide phosphotransferase
MKRITQLSTLPPEDADETIIRAEIPELQRKLQLLQLKIYARAQYGILIILQGLDASGKDGAVRQVFSGVNPAGCRVKSFKVPSEEESKHDFLWRIHQECPEKGMIQIFNRSHYEDVLVPGVRRLLTNSDLSKRIRAINDFEKLLLEQNTILIKFFLHVSEDEQLQRINQRKTDPEKLWKYQESDLKEIALRKKYLRVYDKIFLSSRTLPWHIIPADRKWFRNYLILKELVKVLEPLTTASLVKNQKV